MVYSSSRLCSSFSIVSYSLLSSHVLSVTLTVRFCQHRSLRVLFLPSSVLLFIHHLLHTSWHTLFVFNSFLLSVQFRLFIFLTSCIYFFDTYIYIYCWILFNLIPIYSLISYCAFSFLLLVASIFFLSLLVILLTLTPFNFCHVFPLLRALSNLFLPAFQPARHCDFCNYVLAPFRNTVITSILMWVTVGQYWEIARY